MKAGVLWLNNTVGKWGSIVYGTVCVTGVAVLLLILIWESPAPVEPHTNDINEWNTGEFTEAQKKEIQQYLNELQLREDDK